MKRLLLLTITFAIGATFVVMVSGGSGVAEPRGVTVTDITYSEGFCGQHGSHCKRTNTSHGSDAFGARLIFTLPLRVDGSLIGWEQGECVYLYQGSGEDACTFTLEFDDGIVSVQGVLPYTGERSARIPVTGGTGKYTGAVGFLKYIKGTFTYRLYVETPA